MDKLLAPEPLKEGGNLPEKWKRFKRTFLQFLVATGRVDKTDPVKIALLLRTIGQRGNDIYESFTWETEAGKDKYDKVVENVDQFCAPRVNVVALTHKLLTMKQGQMSVDEYVTALHNVARDCNLGSKEQYDRMMIQALLLGVESDRVRRRLFDQQLSLDEAVATCRAMEAARDDLKTLFENETEIGHAIKPASRRYASSKYKSNIGMKPSAENCSKYGEQHPPRECKAYGKECFKYNKMNHFAKCCNSITVSVRTEKAHLVKNSRNECKYSSDASTNCIHVTKYDRKMIATVTVANGKVKKTREFQQDTAATCNMLTRRDFAKMGKSRLTESIQAIMMYDDSKVIPVGWCTMTVTDNMNCKLTLNLFVTDTKQHSLLSLKACVDLNLITVNDSVHMVADENILAEYDSVFKGIGCLPGEYDLAIDESITPVQVRPRKIPLSTKEEVKTKLDTLTKQCIIEQVESPTPWISHLQPVRKSNGTVRLCIDPQNLNQALKRNHYQMPDIDDVLPQLAEAKMFSLCDAKDGFLQVKVSDKSSHLTTFWTPYGRYKWKRMPFGISTAIEEFQRRLSSALKGLKGVSVVADDILIYGKYQADGDDNLRKILKRARECGLKLNNKKCIGREPGPGLRMFSVKFFSLSFPVNLCRGPSQVCNDHSQLAAFCPQGAKKPFRAA